MRMVFSPDGALLPRPSVDAIRCIRQICLFSKKILLPCTGRRLRLAERKFVEIEQSMRYHVVDPERLRYFEAVSRIIWTDLVQGSQLGDPYDGIMPRHGPGTTAEGLRGNKKYLFQRWPKRLESVLPFSEFGVASLRNEDAIERIQDVTYTLPRDEDPVKVCLVPKTLRTPRVIAAEPVAMQWAQQGIARWMRDRIETQSRFTSGRVNFTRQDVNAQLALTSSRSSGVLGTLDLSDASDRVSAYLVQRMLRSAPALSRYVFATRSTRAKLPSGGVIPLRKFASMGSALCFPIESMVFFLIMVSERARRAGVPVRSSRQILRYCENLYVYGDDILIPVDEAPAMVNALEAFGLKVNSAKSFWTGRFRESCGMDAYDGADVTPVYLRRALPGHRADIHGLVSSVENSFLSQRLC
jgi:hypothetical protein